MSQNLSFGRWLQQHRRALDLTQAELARRVGCATVTIHKIEAEERRPSKEIAERLADVLAVPAEEQGAFVAFARGESAATLPSRLPPRATRMPAGLRAAVEAAAQTTVAVSAGPRPAFVQTEAESAQALSHPFVARERELAALVLRYS